LPDFIDHISNTLSVQQIDHYIQLFQNEKFRKYDYGMENMEIYGTTEPPEYNLSNIITPIYSYIAPEDILSSPKARIRKTNIVYDKNFKLFNSQDADHLIKLLPNVKHNRIIPNYNHADFNYGKRSRKILYHDVLRYFQSEF
jgi:hypothetical protein